MLTFHLTDLPSERGFLITYHVFVALRPQHQRQKKNTTYFWQQDPVPLALY